MPFSLFFYIFLRRSHTALGLRSLNFLNKNVGPNIGWREQLLCPLSVTTSVNVCSDMWTNPSLSTLVDISGEWEQLYRTFWWSSVLYVWLSFLYTHGHHQNIDLNPWRNLEEEKVINRENFNLTVQFRSMLLSRTWQTNLFVSICWN